MMLDPDAPIVRIPGWMVDAGYTALFGWIMILLVVFGVVGIVGIFEWWGRRNGR